MTLEKIAILSSAAFDIELIGDDTIGEPPSESKNPLDVIGAENVFSPAIVWLLNHQPYFQ